MQAGTAIGATVASFLAFAMVTCLGMFAFASAGYRYADGFPQTNVNGLDELVKLGPAVGLVAQAGLVIAACTFVVAIAALVIPRARGWAWLVPLLGAGAWIVAVMIGATSFQPPPPELGG